MTDIAAWGPTIFAGLTFFGGAAAVLLDVGGYRQKTRDAHAIANTCSAKCDLISAQLNEYKAQAAREFASMNALGESERRLAAAVEGIRTDFRAVAERFDKMLIEMARNGKSE